MDPNVTRPIPSANTVLYQCACGEQLVLDPAIGGVCKNCERTVSTKLLEQDLGMTITLDDGSFKLEQTLPGGSVVDDQSQPRVVLSVGEDADPDLLVGKMFCHF